MKKRTFCLSTVFALLAICGCLSCTDMFDSLKEYATEETIYPAGFDTIAVKIGFERAEIELSTRGRIPASQLNLAKATKTIVECPLFDEPLVIDSVSSWVNLTGLTERDEYNLKVYTEDEDGNRSIPKEISFVPYTSADLEQMELLAPKIIESSSTAVLEWENKLSGILYDCYRYTYEYTDKDGAVQRGGGTGDIPSFFIENIVKQLTVPVQLTLHIIPKKNGASIIDTVNWLTTIPVTLPESASDVIFLKAPLSAHSINLNNTTGGELFPFSWTAVAGADSYTLKISSSSDFPADKTLAFDVTNDTMLALSADQLAGLVTQGSASCYWTVVPTHGNTTVNTQTRILNIYRKLVPAGDWLFDDPADLFKARIGQPLIETSPSGSSVTLADGPTASDKAVFVPELAYLTANHLIAPQPNDVYVNEYTVSMNIKLSGFKWFSIADINSSNNNGEWFISPLGELSLNGWWGAASKNMTLNNWHEVVYSVKLDEHVKIYLDGRLVKVINTNASWKNGDYALRPELHLFKDDNSWNDRNTAYVSRVTMWPVALNDMEVAQW